MQQSSILTSCKSYTATHLSQCDLTDWNSINQELDKLKPQSINEVCWEELTTIPTIDFVTAYNSQALMVKFYINESSHQAIYKQTNEPVFKDSCVEFFIAIDECSRYYNFEFNSNGTCLASYGENRYNRKKLNSERIETIKRNVNWITYSPLEHNFKWEITVVFLPEIFCYHDVKSFCSVDYKVNFYKCGDDLVPLHYLAWNKIMSPERDFHRPEYFGILHLE